MKRFAEVAEQDKEFAEKFTVAMKAKNINEVIRLAAEKGFTLKADTADDFAFDGMRELAPEELENVAGGDLLDIVEKECGAVACTFCTFGLGTLLLRNVL